MNAPAKPTETLPDMVSRAAAALAKAGDAAEVLAAHDLASFAFDAATAAGRLHKARNAHDEIISATVRAQADALDIEAAAKHRLADEYDAAQQRGEVQKPGKPVNVPDGNNKATLGEIGLSRKDVLQARRMRDLIAGRPGIVRKALDQLMREGDQVSRAALQRTLAPVTTAMRADKTREKKVRRHQREIELSVRQAALPDKKYGLIYSDPEWKFKPYSTNTGMDRAAENHYPTSELVDMMRRDVGALAADDCIYLQWSTVPMLIEAICLLDAYGFAAIDRDSETGFLMPDKRRCKYVSHYAWDKGKIANGYWTRGKHELLLIATRGNPVAPAMGEQLDSLFASRATEHSAKPDLVLDWIDRQWPNTAKIELNRRGPARPGWDAWGNEAEAAA